MRNPAMINRRYESGDIADHSAAEADDKRFSVKPRADHLIANHAGLRERFRFLASGNRDQNWPKTRRY